jgi:hypothetical protein
MRVAIHQPQYLPWLGYLAKWAAADLLIFLDTVQYQKNGWQNRNRVKTSDGARWLTVPVKARLGARIDEIPIDERQPWARRHLATIEQSYATSPHLPAHRDALRRLYDDRWTELVTVATASVRWLGHAVGIRTPTCRASELAVTATDPTDRLVRLCRAVGATTYLAGRDGAAYLDLGRFRDAGIDVLHQRYEHPVYGQPHGPFVPFLSGLDLLLSAGNEALDVLRGGDRWTPVGV